MKFLLLTGKDATWAAMQAEEAALKQAREDFQDEVYQAHMERVMDDSVRRLYMREDRALSVSRWDCMLDSLKELRRINILSAWAK